MKNTETIGNLKSEFLKEAKVETEKVTFLRLFLNGKELNPNDILIDHNVAEDQIIQAFLSLKQN